MLIHVLNTALPVFIALFLGVLCRKKEILSRAGVDTLKKVAVDICLPAVLFSAFATAEYSAKGMLVPLFVFFLCCLALGLGVLLKKLFRQESRLMPFLMTGFEAGMLGYGLYALLFPGEGTAAFAIVDLGQVLFVFTLYKGLLYGKGSAGELARQAVASPVLWAIVIGMVFGMTELYSALAPSGVAGIIDGVTDFIAAPTSCLILITIGFDLELKNTPWRKVLSYTGMRVCVMALLLCAALLVNKYVLGGTIRTEALLLLMILPAPFVLPVFADVEEERSAVASTLSVMTLLSLLIFCVMAAVYA